ncbi:hypothetical protein SOVF_134430 [Spinacia oleracea]|nr:hypothetical protein SOVF_134430 [Spinacia oleracea]
MKLVFAILALFMAITTAQARELSNDDTDKHNDNYIDNAAYTDLLFHPPVSAPVFNNATNKCYKAVHNPHLKSCSDDVRKYYKSHKISFSHECCTALRKLRKACPIIKAHHPFIFKLAKTHCK